MLEAECSPVPICRSDALGIAPDHVEALAFAWLAREHVEGSCGNLPAVTGARGPRVLGARYPK
jgi:anhydro-N-acetylmuramic acid kinase